MQNISANASKMIAEELIPEKLKKLSITQHISRIEASINGIIGMLNQDREHMSKVKEHIQAKSAQARNDATELMTTLKSETERLKNMFSVSNFHEKKQLQQLKSEVQKISGQHVKTDQLSYQVDNRVRHCENEIGFRELFKRN